MPKPCMQRLSCDDYFAHANPHTGKCMLPDFSNEDKWLCVGFVSARVRNDNRCMGNNQLNLEHKDGL